MSRAHAAGAHGARARAAFPRLAFLRTPSQQYVYEEAR